MGADRRFDSPSVRFWNASTRALHAYRSNRFERAVECFGEAIELTKSTHAARPLLNATCDYPDN